MKKLSPEKIEQKNFVLNFVEGSFYSASGALISAQTVLPALVQRLGGDNVAVGAIGVTVWVGLFLPQIFASRYVEAHPWKKPWAIKYGIAQRIVLLVYGLCLLAFGERQPQLALWLLLFLYALNQVLIGITTPGWFEMFAKMVPTTRRGRLVGIRSSLGGIGGIGCGALLTWFLATFSFPFNFSLVFFGAFVLQAVSIFAQAQLVEAEPSPVQQRKPFFTFLNQLPNVFRENIPFRNFIIATCVQILATMPIGFYTVYALSRFNAGESIIGQFTLAIVAIQVAISFGMGYLADKRGNKLILVIAASALLCANTLALLAPSLELFTLVYIFLGITLGTETLARYNISIEYCPPEQRATYVGLMNTVIAPFYFVGMLGGFISNTFGYATVFGIGTCCSVIGILLMLFFVKEPRVTTPVESSAYGVVK